MPEPGADRTTRTLLFVWDLPTRLFHWLLAILFALCWWTAETRQMELHQQCGLAILGLLVFRFYWGFAGSRTARFSDFIAGPRRTLAHLKSMFSKTYVATSGHNPLGGWSVLAMLLCMALQVALGLFAVDVDGLESGPLARHVDFDTGRLAAKLHGTVFTILQALVVLHLVAIAFYAIAKKTNLVGPMMTGRTTHPAVHANITTRPAPSWRVVPGVVFAIVTVWLIAG